MREKWKIINKSDYMRNYYIQIHEYLEKIIRNIIVLDKKGISTSGSYLSIIDIFVLKVLGNEQGKKMFEVMETLNIDRNTFKTIINRLTYQDYIVKHKSNEDKRAYSLQLTDKGIKAFEEITDKENLMLVSLLNDFTFNEERTILKFLVKLEMLNREKK